MEDPKASSYEVRTKGSMSSNLIIINKGRTSWPMKYWVPNCCTRWDCLHHRGSPFSFQRTSSKKILVCILSCNLGAERYVAGYTSAHSSSVAQRVVRFTTFYRADFLGIYIFDVWANHRDHRQAVFSTRQTNRAINAHFIDNGHLFGGPHWDFRDKPGAAMCLDRNLYTTTWQESDVDAWISRFETSIPQSLSRVTQQVPQDWYNGNIDELISCLLFRLSDLSNLFQLEVEHNQRIKILPRTGSGNASMPLRHSRSSPIRSIFGRSSFLVAPRC